MPSNRSTNCRWQAISPAKQPWTNSDSLTSTFKPDSHRGTETVIGQRHQDQVNRQTYQRPSATVSRTPQLSGKCDKHAVELSDRTSSLPLNVISRDLSSELEGVLNGIRAQFDRLFRVIPGAFTVWQSCQGNGQRQEIEKLFITSLLVGGGSGIWFGHKKAPSNFESSGVKTLNRGS